MDWSSLDLVPHIAQLSEETACLWQAVYSQQGILAVNSLQQWKVRLDADPRGMPPTLFVDPLPADVHQLSQVYGFPVTHVPQLPGEPALSLALAKALSSPIPGLLKQSEIAAEIASLAHGAHIIVLLVMDGLAYEDVLNWNYPAAWKCKRRPCFVDGVTITHIGMPRVIGTPPLAHRLFLQGYKQHLGFTYWHRESNELTNALFSEFSKQQLTRVNEFADILDRLASSNFSSPTYIQIVRNGLDQFVHTYREHPNIRNFLRELELAVQQLLDILVTFQCSVSVYVTADHGILWFDGQGVVDTTDNPQSARYVPNHIYTPNDKFSRLSEASGNYTVAVGPNRIFRNRRHSEWGFHGGISGRESLIPFLALAYKP